MTEEKWLSELIEGLDFGSLKILRKYAVVAPTLAFGASYAQQIQIARLKKSPAQFYLQQWRLESDANIKIKTIDNFYEKIRKWPWNEHVAIQDSPVLPVVHGTDRPIAWKIASEGFSALSTLDAGFYGKGIYFSTSSVYTVPYLIIKRKPAILICLTLPGNPYPVTQHRDAPNSLADKHILSGYQSHYVTVTKIGNPFTKEDYDKSYKQYDELVIGQEAQIIPIFLLDIEEQSVRALADEFARETVPPAQPPQIETKS